MNLLMILIIILAIWVCGAICYFAWQLMPDDESPQDAKTPDQTAGRDMEDNQ